MEFTVPAADTEVDIAIHQEGHTKRQSTGQHLADLGFGVLKREAPQEYSLISTTIRKPQPAASETMKLGKGTYIVVPMSFNQLNVPAPRKFVLVSGSSQPLMMEKCVCEARWQREALSSPPVFAVQWSSWSGIRVSTPAACTFSHRCLCSGDAPTYCAAREAKPGAGGTPRRGQRCDVLPSR